MAMVTILDVCLFLMVGQSFYSI